MYRHGYCCHKVMETLLIVFRLVARFFCLVISLCGSNSRMWMPWRKISHRSSYEGRTACHTKVSRLLFGCFQMFNVYVSGITDAYICECACNDRDTDDNDIIYIYILSSVTWMCLILSNTATPIYWSAQPIVKADGKPTFNTFHPPFWCAVSLWWLVQNDNESKSLVLQFIEPSSNF